MSKTLDNITVVPKRLHVNGRVASLQFPAERRTGHAVFAAWKDATTGADPAGRSGTGGCQW